MLFSLDQIINMIIQFRYVLLFPIVFVEGPIATVIAGFLSAHRYLNPLISYVVVSAADLSADVLYYVIGAAGNGRWAEKMRAWLGLNEERLELLTGYFEKHSFKTFAAGKILHGPGVAVLIAAGMARVPLRKYLGYNTIVTLPKSFVLLIIGYFFGQLIRQLQQYFDLVALSLTVVSVVLVVVVILFWRWFNEDRL